MSTRRRRVSRTFLVPLTASLLLAACSGKTAPPPPAPVDVSVITATPRPASTSIDYVAQTEALNTVEIRPRVGGLLESEAVQEGSPIHKGQLLFTIDAQPYEAALAQAKAALAQAQAALDQADRDLARVQPLSAIDAVSQQELDAAIARRSANRASVEAARAALKTAELNLGYTRLYSPIDGTLGRAQLKVGGLVTAYQTLLATVYSIDPMYVNFSISEQRVLELQRRFGRPITQSAKMPPTFKVLLADGSEYPYPGKLNFIDAAVDQRTGTLGVRLELPNPQKLLRANQFARVRIASAEIPDALLVPQRAVQDLQGKNFLWLVDADGKAAQRDVVMGARLGGDWLVQSGLKPGDVVIVDGVQKLKPGRPVKAEPLAGQQIATAPAATPAPTAKTEAKADAAPQVKAEAAAPAAKAVKAP
ncbi:MAG: efflux RND transporter periplasmic adaptor subunit [Nevskia sp.]